MLSIQKVQKHLNDGGLTLKMNIYFFTLLAMFFSPGFSIESAGEHHLAFPLPVLSK